MAAPADLAGALLGSRIAFESRKSGQADIYLMNPDGSGRTRFTTWAGDELQPAWSRDNKHLAFVRQRVDATNTKHWDVYLMDADGTHKHWARSTPSGFNILDPSWAPDGKHLVVRVDIGNSYYLATMELGTDKMAFVWNNTPEIVAGSSPSYSPSGASIVYVAAGGESIYEVYPDGDPYPLVSGTTPVGTPVWSPDGKKIAYSRVVANNMDVYVLTRATLAVKRLTTNPAWDGDPSWSKDGTKIAFASSRSAPSQIYIMSATGTGQTRITHNTLFEDMPAFTH